ncbi:sorbosone dehydrogenase family protein [Methylophilus sp. 5]|uniref:PQQ-dependent sugar dehydrogenase n=1 Tax=Methylophilus sp. 5 TaxID=1112274 RepID=UPI00048D9BC7|nr:PQQ-dependent sugar dehydrogenase [Methylophilus sp. 5]
MTTAQAQTSQANKVSRLLLIALAGLSSAIGLHYAMAQTPEVEAALSTLEVPTGLKVERFSDVSAWGAPRMLALDKQGQLLVSLSDTGRVLRLNAQGEAEVIAQGLNAPHGLTLLGDDLLVAEQTGVVKLPKQGNGWGAPQPFIRNLPSGGHSLKTINISPDGYIFINVGSSCNVCVEDNPTRATLLRYTTEGRPAGAMVTVGRHAQSATWASGLRNSQGFTWHPDTGEMFATNNGADNRSGQKNGKVDDDLPPEHLNRIEAGQHYGWPYCWSNPEQPAQLMQDPNFSGETGVCQQAQAPAITLPAHSTPIGITFLHQSRLPASIKQDAIVALHGSWNRKQPSGYALLRVQFRNQKPVTVVPFIHGWLQGKQAWGRPVDVIVGADGWLYVSDDLTGWIYRIRSTQAP